jgi:DNA-binding transcriptional LysR family regulator
MPYEVQLQNSAMSPDLLPAVAAFARVAHHASFTRASQEMGVSPSALSQTVRMLEARLGVRLLDRTTRRVGITEIGQRFLNGTLPALVALDGAIAGIEEVRDKPSGVLRLNLSRVSADLLVLPHLDDFFSAYPEVTVEVRCENGFIDLVAGGFDAGIRLGESLAKDVIAIPFGGPQRLATFAAPSYLARFPAPCLPEDLRDHRCLNYRFATGGIYRWEYVQDGRVLNLEVSGPLVSNDGDVLLAAARAGSGITWAFEDVVRADFANGRLVPLLEEWWPTFPGFYLYYPSRFQMPRKLRAFIDFMRSRPSPASVSQSHQPDPTPRVFTSQAFAVIGADAER